MAKAVKAKQVSLSMKDRVGALAEVAGALAAKKVNITAICAYAMDGEGIFWVIADDAAKAKRALAGLGKTGQDDVIMVEMPDRPGAMAEVAGKVAKAGVDVHYVYATAGKKTATLVVMKTDDDRKAIKAINS